MVYFVETFKDTLTSRIFIYHELMAREEMALVEQSRAREGKLDQTTLLELTEFSFIKTRR